jgi:flavin reductase (DIM6/NTAB) family NADH-FMN oxidoreductase RutF
VLGPDQFRRTLGHFASGVTVVTTCDAAGRPAGLTASAFTSVSLNPPLVLVCVAHNAQSFPLLKASRGFVINILASGQETVSNRFASSVGDAAEKFNGVAHKAGVLGYPMLDGALAHLECVTVHAYAGGDHTIFVGQVEAAAVAGDGQGGEVPAGDTTVDPLLYFRGRYGRIAPAEGAS